MKHIWLLISFLYACLNTFSHPKCNYYFEQIMIADGLSQNHITCIHQDAQGFISAADELLNKTTSSFNQTMANKFAEIKDSFQELKIGFEKAHLHLFWKLPLCLYL